MNDWHDLINNPNDLPIPYTHVITLVTISDGTVKPLGNYIGRRNEWNCSRSESVVAWKYFDFPSDILNNHNLSKEQL